MHVSHQWNAEPSGIQFDNMIIVSDQCQWGVKENHDGNANGNGSRQKVQ